jgi:hypothetical protein
MARTAKITRDGILNKRSLSISAVAALAVAVALAGCGTTTYFAGRTLPPSGLTNRVLIAIQNPSSTTRGALQFVDAYYDIRHSYNNKIPIFTISGYSGALPITIQNMPEEEAGAVYGSADGSFQLINYAQEKIGTAITPANGPSSSVFVTRNQQYVFAASQQGHVLSIQDRTGTGGVYSLGLPGIYRVSVNPGGSAALAFVQNSNYVYYPRKLSAGETVAYGGGQANWPKAAVDCEPQTAPGWCLFQAQSPDHTDATGNAYGAPLSFDRPVKAVFSADGGTAYVLNCGPECGGTASSYTALPVAPIIYLVGQVSGTLPTQTALNDATIKIAGGASNALVDGTTLYVVGQCLADQALSSASLPQCAASASSESGLFTGMLTVVNLTNTAASAPISISDGEPGFTSRIIRADDDTLWIGMTKCTNGARYAANLPYGCLTMYSLETKTATLLPYIGDATGIAAVTGLHKIYSAQGGQVYINSTIDGSYIDNSNVTVTGTAYDVAYMDGTTDTNNTVY